MISLNTDNDSHKAKWLHRMYYPLSSTTCLSKSRSL